MSLYQKTYINLKSYQGGNNLKLKIIDIIEDYTCYIVKLSNEKYIRLGVDELKYLMTKLEYENEKEILLPQSENVLSNDIKKVIDNKIKEYKSYEKEKSDSGISMIKLVTINPDKFLNFFYRYSKCIYSMPVFVVYIFFNIVCFFLIGNNGEKITNDLSNLQLDTVSIIVLYTAMILTLMLHEIGHATVCKKYGGKVTKMGVVLFFLAPCLYCDVSDIYMFRGKKGKILVSVAGLYINSIMSLIAIFFYCTLNTSDSISSLLLLYYIANVGFIIYNLIPFVKLDGYWLLAGLLNISNLYMKSLICALVSVFDRRLLNNIKISRIKRNIMSIYGFISLIFRPVFWMCALIEIRLYLQFNINKYIIDIGSVMVLIFIIVDLYKFYREVFVKYKTERVSIVNFL